ncbi:MAG: CapA family protein [Treponema sp.]|nr:CapA family protein [Treponema sp.]
MKLFSRATIIRFSFLTAVFFCFLFASCGTTKTDKTSPLEKALKTQEELENQNKDTLTLLFAGDIMAHSVNYNISDYPKIWRDVKYIIEPCDLAFANIEAPVDDTQKPQNYPNFNMPQAYVEAAIDAGFDVFSLCNNHTNDQALNGIKETKKSADRLVKRSLERSENIYFSGLKDGKDSDFSYNIIEKNAWTLLFIPITEILNRPNYSEYINYLDPSAKNRDSFVQKVQKLREKHPCDLMIISIHANEPEYTRAVTKSQNDFYMKLLDAGADIIWANHAHIIKDRKYIYYHQTDSHKVVMYANGNTISGQRTKPELSSTNPIGERDNTGDGLMVKLTFKKGENGNPPQIINSENYFITTYINTAEEFVLKPMTQEFIDYLNEIPRADWAKYIQRRLDINNEYTKDLILWQ